MGMPLDQFTDEAYKGLVAGKEEVAVGDAQGWYDKIETPRQELFHDFAKAMKQRYNN